MEEPVDGTLRGVEVALVDRRFGHECEQLRDVHVHLLTRGPKFHEDLVRRDALRPRRVSEPIARRSCWFGKQRALQQPTKLSVHSHGDDDFAILPTVASLHKLLLDIV